MSTKIRLDKYLSHIADIPRRRVKKLLKNKGIRINESIVIDPSTKFNPLIDNVYFEGKLLKKLDHVYFMLNKPKGVVSTVDDELGRPTVLSIIDTERKIYPIGRLDKETHGLILLTDDGPLTHKLIHPRFHVPKTYILTITGNISEIQIATFEQGVNLSDGITLPTKVSILETSSQISRMQVTLYEGRNQQIRRMCYTLGIELLDLQRIALGPIKLGNLPEGASKQLTQRQISLLKEAGDNK